MRNFLCKKLSDLIITIPIFLIGFTIIFLLFYFDIQTNKRTLFESFVILYLDFPIIFAAIYLWLMAVIEDFLRINKQISLTMPATVFIMYALEWTTIWMVNNLLYNNIATLGKPSQLRSFLLFKYPVIFWVILDILSLTIFNLIMKQRKVDFSLTKFSANKVYEVKLFEKRFLSFICFNIAILVSILCLY